MKNRNADFNRLRHRCPACGRTTVKKPRHIPFYDARCGPCVERNFRPQTIPQGGGLRRSGARRRCRVSSR